MKIRQSAGRLLAALSCVLLLPSSGFVVAAQDPLGDFQLRLMRHYGRHIFIDCNLDVIRFEERAVASLHCEHSGPDARGRPIPPVESREELSREDSRRLADLVGASALFEGGHTGRDDSPSDGTFEVLKLRSKGRAVMVVTSGNPTFEGNTTRASLLSFLRTIEKRLADAGSKRR